MSFCVQHWGRLAEVAMAYGVRIGAPGDAQSMLVVDEGKLYVVTYRREWGGPGGWRFEAPLVAHDMIVSNCIDAEGAEPVLDVITRGGCALCFVRDEHFKVCAGCDEDHDFETWFEYGMRDAMKYGADLGKLGSA